MASSRATRSAVGGWVLNSLLITPPVCGERIDLGERGYRRRHVHGDLVREVVQPDEGVGQRHGPAQDQGAHPIRLELPLAGDGELNQHRADRSQQDQRQLGERMSTFVVLAAAEHQQVGKVAERPGDARGHGGNEHVPVLDVGQLVGNDALQLGLRHVLEDAGRYRHHRVLGIAAGGKGIGLLVRRHRDGRHGKSGLLAKAVDHGIELRRLLGGHDVRPVHLEHQAVGEEVHDEVEETAEYQGDDESAGATEQLADQQEQAEQPGQEYKGLDVVHGAPSCTSGAKKRARPRPLRFRVDEGLALRCGSGGAACCSS